VAFDGVVVLDVGQDLDPGAISIQGGKLLLHDWHGRRANDLSRRVAHNRRVQRRICWWIHGRNVRRLLHRVDVGAEHEHCLHTIRLGSTDS